MKIFSDKQLKINKSNTGSKHIGVICHLKPKRSTCPFAGLCAKKCFSHYGQLGMAERKYSTQEKRTVILEKYPEAFCQLAGFELDNHIEKAHKNGSIPCCRLNGSSDVYFLDSKYGDFIERYSEKGIVFYDYTKNPDSIFNPAHCPKTGFYPLAYSLNEKKYSVAVAKKALQNLVPIAIVMDNTRTGNHYSKWECPETYRFCGKEYPVFNGESTDFWFTSDHYGKRPFIIGLRPKWGIESIPGFCRKVK